MPSPTITLPAEPVSRDAPDQQAGVRERERQRLLAQLEQLNAELVKAEAAVTATKDEYDALLKSAAAQEQAYQFALQAVIRCQSKLRGFQTGTALLRQEKVRLQALLMCR